MDFKDFKPTNIKKYYPVINCQRLHVLNPKGLHNEVLYGEFKQLIQMPKYVEEAS